MRWARRVAQMGEEEKKNAYTVLVRKPEEKRPSGRPRRKSVDNTELDVRGMGWTELFRLRTGTSGGLL
jgi:hypothetical protein